MVVGVEVVDVAVAVVVAVVEVGGVVVVAVVVVAVVAAGVVGVGEGGRSRTRSGRGKKAPMNTQQSITTTDRSYHPQKNVRAKATFHRRT